MEAIKIVNDLFGYLFYICFFALFYFSLERCFLQENGKVKLFFQALFTNPLLLYIVSFYSSGIMAYACFMTKTGWEMQGVDASEYGRQWFADPFNSSLVVLIASFLFIAITILTSYLMGKSLKAHNRSLVMFVYVMFSVIVILNDDRSASVPQGAGWAIEMLCNVNNIVYTMVVWLLFLFVMKALSELTDRKRHIHWKLFLLPPIAFLITYSVFDYYTYMYWSADANTIAQILSMIILILFIWAFYVIINNIKATDDAINAKEDVKTLSVEVMEALAHTIDAKDEYTRGHSVRVAKYSRMLAEKLGLAAEECENVYYMALLHDIGKIGVPNEIINSPTKLTDEEYAVIKTHPGVGYDILAEIKSRPDLSIGARWHHERYDGKGYPDGKAGEDIPYYARIIAVADSYDAMTSNRSYRKYMAQEAVRAEIEKNSGTQFDPDLAKCMLEIMDEDKNYELHE